MSDTNRIVDAAGWRQFESARWHAAVRERALQLRYLDLEERQLVLEAIVADLERRKCGGERALPAGTVA